MSARRLTELLKPQARNQAAEPPREELANHEMIRPRLCVSCGQWQRTVKKPDGGVTDWCSLHQYPARLTDSCRDWIRA